MDKSREDYLNKLDKINLQTIRIGIIAIIISALSILISICVIGYKIIF